MKDDTELTKSSYGIVWQRIIMFAILNPLLLLCWFGNTDSNRTVGFIALGLVLIQLLVSIYGIMNVRLIGRWLASELYLWVVFSMAMFLAGYSGFVTVSTVTPLQVLYPILFLGCFVGWYKAFKPFWDATLDDNIKSGKIDTVNGSYSIVHQQAQYKFKNPALNKWLGIMSANSAVIIVASAFYGVMVSRQLRQNDIVMWSIVIGTACLVTIMVSMLWINLEWIMRWERAEGRRMKTKYVY